MVESTMIYRGDLRVEATHGPSGAEIATDAPADNGGKGRAFSPTDLLAASLGSCALTVMGLAAKRDGFSLEGARASVQKEMHTTGVRRVKRLGVHFELPAGLTDEQVATCKRAAETCPVTKSLHPEVAVELTFSRAE